MASVLNSQASEKCGQLPTHLDTLCAAKLTRNVDRSLNFQLKQIMNKPGNFFLSISTTAGVILFTMGFLSMLEEESYWMAGLFLLFAFWLPLQSEAIENKVIKRSTQAPTREGTADDENGEPTR